MLGASAVDLHAGRGPQSGCFRPGARALSEMLPLLLASIALLLLYSLATRNHRYWRRRGLAGSKPLPFFGTHRDVLLTRVSFADFSRRSYETFPGRPYVGELIAWRPGLLVRDPDLVRRVLAQDFHCFPGRAHPYCERGDPLSSHLFHLEGPAWRCLRTQISPGFASGRLRHVFPLLLNCCEELLRVLDGPACRQEAVDVRDVLSRFTTDIISSCALGVSFDTLRNPGAEIRRLLIQFFERSLWNKLRFALLIPFPKSTFLHWLLRHRRLSDFFIQLVKDMASFRRASSIRRGDFLDLLVDLNREKQDKTAASDVHESSKETCLKKFILTDESMAAQVFVFFAAGLETSSAPLSLCLVELAHNTAVQEEVRAEVDGIWKRFGRFTYDSLAEMTYLDRVVAETLRKYPPASMLLRECVRPYRLPCGVQLEPGTIVSVPVMGLHYDPAYFPQPERFDPERFQSAARARSHPYTYLPFGEGPRRCIGMRFGLVQMKLGLATLLHRYEVTPSSLMEYPVRFAKGSLVTAPEKCFVHLRKRNETAAFETTA